MPDWPKRLARPAVFNNIIMKTSAFPKQPCLNIDRIVWKSIFLQGSFETGYLMIKFFIGLLITSCFGADGRYNNLDEARRLAGEQHQHFLLNFPLCASNP